MSEYLKQYYIDNKPEYAVRRQRFLSANPNYKKEYYQKNKAAFQERAKNRDKNKVREQQSRYNQTPKGIFSNAKKTAKDRKIPFTLTFNEFVTSRGTSCYYCQGPLPKKGVGLDRINHHKGYVPGNVVPSCWNCNTIKGDKFTMEETKVMVDALLAFRRSSSS